jgi:hypothetical protein
MRALSVLVALLFACQGVVTKPDAGGGNFSGGAQVGPDGGCTTANERMRLALAPACSGCHNAGSRDYWSSLEVFEAQLVYNPRFVVPQNPNASVLIQLLNGTALGSTPQMPPGETFASLASSGRVNVTVAQVADWIGNLQPRKTTVAEAKPENFAVRRLRGEEMVQALMDQLGLGLEDFVSTDRPQWREEELVAFGRRFFVFPKDWAPGVSKQYVSDSQAYERFEGLGGAANLDNRKKDAALGPAALQVITQMSQAWCQRAVEKPANKAVLGALTLADTSASKASAIKQNIARLHLRMLAEPAAPEFIEELYREVFVPAEVTSTAVAWTAVCAVLARHPQWLSF